MYNVLLGCDNLYYNKWTKNCIRSIQKFAPWINITVIIVNPIDLEKITNVRYIFNYINFENENSKIAYYQSVRFLKCVEVFPDEKFIMSIDCDTILTRPFSQEEFLSICKTIHIQRHQKDVRWMAGLVTYGTDVLFRKQLKEKLLSIPIKNWVYGWDQTVINELSKDFNYNKLLVGDWMSFGRGNGKFLTLKGDQKISQEYLEKYKSIVKFVT